MSERRRMRLLKGGAYQQFRTARKEHQCSNIPRHRIFPGEHYCALVAMPNHDANTTRKPWHLAECMNCCDHPREQQPAAARQPDGGARADGGGG